LIAGWLPGPGSVLRRPTREAVRRLQCGDGERVVDILNTYREGSNEERVRRGEVSRLRG
jgi:hypothetical protein